MWWLGKFTEVLHLIFNQYTFNIFYQVIDKRWILTAGHCVVDVVQVMVHFGAINQFGDGRSGAFVKQINVTNSKDIIMHKAYNSRTYANDIALIKLPEDAPIGNSNVGLVALPNGTEFSRNLTGLQATIAGFGKVWHTREITSYYEILSKYRKVQWQHWWIITNPALCNTAYSRQFTLQWYFRSRDGNEQLTLPPKHRSKKCMQRVDYFQW